MPDVSEDLQRVGSQSVGQIKENITNLSPEAKQSVATETIQALPPEDKENVAAEVVRSLSADAKQGVASETLLALSPEATKDIATEAMQSLPPETKKMVATEMARALSPEDQADLVGRLQGPTQQITNRIWQVIVWTFAIVLVLSVGALLLWPLSGPKGQEPTSRSFLRWLRPLQGFSRALSPEGQAPAGNLGN